MQFAFSFSAVILLAATALHLAAASPTTKPPSCRSTAFLDKFDDRAALPVSSSGLSAVNNYGGLFYKSFNLVAQLPLAPLSIPPSSPNYIFSGLVTQSTLGQTQFLPSTEKKVQYFDLQKIAFACATQGGGPAVSCTVLVAGVKKDTGETVVQDLVYDPGLLPDIKDVVSGKIGKPFGSASFPASRFAGLKSVTISIISASTTTAATNVLFDNVGYNACISA